MPDRHPLTLVAGGAGFIGANLCRALIASGEEVVCMDNLQTSHPANLAALQRLGGFSFVEADICDPLPASIRARADRITRIYNLACAASPPLYQRDPEHTMMTCVLGHANLLHLAEQTGARLLLASTSEVYGDPEIHPQVEGYLGNVNCTGPRACYDEGKRAAETLTFDFARLGRASVRVARIFNTYGPHMRPDDGRVVSNFVCQALMGEPITVHGDGSQTRSFCFVDDMVAGLRALMESDFDRAEPVNLGNPAEMRIDALVDLMLSLTGSSSKVEYLPLPRDDPRRRRPNIARAGAELGWQPCVPLAEGLPRTIGWFAEEVGVDQRFAAE